MKTERRLWCEEVEVREAADGGPPRLVGHAAVFNRETSIGPYREVVRPGAFKRAIKEKQDVRALFNHNPDAVLGRTRAGTLTIEEDADGLRVAIDPPDTQGARDVMTLVKRGDVTGMSFAFLPAKGGARMDDDNLRELTDVDLFDVSVVTYPAYEAASVALRSLSAAAETERPAPVATARDQYRQWLSGCAVAAARPGVNSADTGRH